MSNSRLHQLHALGQSIWFDYIRRAFINSGELQSLVDQGVRGVTSNPSIFEKAIAGSADYDAALRPLVDAGKSVAEIYESLALGDKEALQAGGRRVIRFHLGTDVARGLRIFL
ncbi:MAG: hypothetical protein D6790_06090 [Caldilineae bacterium]|nr:MAG: hypothetical protein D6790_06090 [Caldilineae bacterium]